MYLTIKERAYIEALRTDIKAGQEVRLLPRKGITVFTALLKFSFCLLFCSEINRGQFFLIISVALAACLIFDMIRLFSEDGLLLIDKEGLIVYKPFGRKQYYGPML